jgi:cytochrome P450
VTFPFAPGPRGTVPPEYSRLLASQPVSKVRLIDGTEIWLVTRHQDVQIVLSRSQFSRHRAATLPGVGFGRSQGNGIVDLDPPEHTRLRKPVAAAFNSARVLRWRPRIEAIAEEILSDLATNADTVDLVSDYAAPFAAHVTCELLGIAASQRKQITSDVELLLLPQGQQAATLEAAHNRIREALTELLATRRAAPGDDVTTTLLGLDPEEAEARTGEAAGSALDDSDRIILLHGLIMSGFIGVRDMLARQLFGVLSTPDLRARLRVDPDTVPSAVEELLRYYPSSNDGLLRVATEDVVLSGTRIPAGAPVLPLVSAASRDPAVFLRPDVVDIDRTADRGIAFGGGRHACPAADLARIELTVGLSRLLRAFPEIALAIQPDDVEHNSDLLPVGIRALPVVLRQLN